MIKSIIDDPFLQLNRFLGEIYKVILRFRKGIHLGNNVKFKGCPIIQNYGGTVVIGDNSTLYSTAYGYFAHYSNKVRLFVEDSGQIILAEGVRINGATIHSRKEIKIGRNTLIAANTSTNTITFGTPMELKD